jgi:hypothetical protein
MGLCSFRLCHNICVRLLEHPSFSHSARHYHLPLPYLLLRLSSTRQLLKPPAPACPHDYFTSTVALKHFGTLTTPVTLACASCSGTRGHMILSFWRRQCQLVECPSACTLVQ